MKTNNFLQHTEKILVTFILAMVVVVAVSSFNESKCLKHHHEQVYNDVDFSKANQQEQAISINTVSPAEESEDAYLKIEQIDKEKAKLQQGKEKLTAELKKLREDRVKDYGMVAGICYQMPQDVPEITYLEGKINSLDNKMIVLDKEKKALIAKNKKDTLREIFHP